MLKHFEYNFTRFRFFSFYLFPIKKTEKNVGCNYNIMVFDNTIEYHNISIKNVQRFHEYNICNLFYSKRI